MYICDCSIYACIYVYVKDRQPSITKTNKSKVPKCLSSTLNLCVYGASILVYIYSISIIYNRQHHTSYPHKFISRNFN